jgi:hypothetical protein
MGAPVFPNKNGVMGRRAMPMMLSWCILRMAQIEKVNSK